ncbi:MAG: 4-hydroxy-3-methylbut-2-enyl diphosphate reductase [Verrucomicrobiales bacterium]
MKIRLAEHFGMCFGVRDALRKVHEVAGAGPVTVLGQLVHNPVVSAHLATLGVREGELGAVGDVETGGVVITAHGAADGQRRAWREAGYAVTDTTCPLVRKAHAALAGLVRAGYFPVVIGRKGHVEVRGLTGDFAEAVVVEGEGDLNHLPTGVRLGVVSQTTQPVERVRRLVEAMRLTRPGQEVRFIDTVCQPTKDRQEALEALCHECPVVVVVGGRNSNNTRELVARVQALGAIGHHVEGADDLDPQWFNGVETVGVTAGTSTLDETVETVVNRLRLLAASLTPEPAHGLLRMLA